MMSFNSLRMNPATVHLIVDSFFDAKKLEVKEQLRTEMDRVVDRLFAGLVGTVKDLLIAENASEEVIPKVSNQKIESGGGCEMADNNLNASLKTNASNVQNFTTQLNEPKTQQPKFFKSRSIFPLSTHNKATESGNVNQPPKQGPNQIAYAVKSNSGALKVQVKRSNSEEFSELSEVASKKARIGSPSFKPSTSPKPPLGKQYRCELDNCGKLFPTPTKLKRHQQSQAHLNIKPYSCKWPACNYSSAEKSHTLRHIQTCHLNKQQSKESENFVPEGEQNPGVGSVDPKDYLEVNQDLLNS